MGNSTSISWTDATWNPIRGCSRVSAGCTNCYAETVARRFSGPGLPYEGLTNQHGRWNGTVRMIPEHLADPLRWKKPRRIFVNSMSDLFHESLTNEQIDQVFAVMLLAPRHTFQVLTKRAERMRRYMNDPALYDRVLFAAGKFRAERPDLNLIAVDNPTTCPKPWIWLGVSVENQDAANERIPELLATPAAIRFLSCEPLIGEVDITRWMLVHKHWRSADTLPSGAAPPYPLVGYRMQALVHAGWKPVLHWVIAGCESGHGSRPCDVLWMQSLRDQCAAGRVAFFLKQAVETDVGRCGDADNPNGDDPCGERISAYVVGPGTASYSCSCCVEGPEDGACIPLGFGEGSKRKSGGVIELPYLDGVQHAAFPEVR